MNRRSFLRGGLVLLAAPSIVRVASIMPVRAAPLVTTNAIWWSAMQASHDGQTWFDAPDAFQLIGNGGAIRANRRYPHVRVQSRTVEISGPTYPVFSVMEPPSLASAVIKL